MDGIFGALVWIVIIFIWVFSALKKIRRKDSRAGEKTPSELEKKILEALGMSFPEIPEPTIQKPPEAKIEAKAPCEVPKPAITTVIAEETERESPDGSTTLTISAERSRSTDLSTVENLQEGIVFSVILGPPKAYRFFGLYSKKPSR